MFNNKIVDEFLETVGYATICWIVIIGIDAGLDKLKRRKTTCKRITKR